MSTRTTASALAAIVVGLAAGPAALADRGDKERGDHDDAPRRAQVRVADDHASINVRISHHGKPSIDFRYGYRTDYRGRRSRYGHNGPSARRGPGYRSPRRRADNDHYSSSYDHERRGWRYLGKNRPHRAMKSFARATRYEPYSASIKAGYAVAAGLYGDTYKGAWAMRRAIALGPDRIMYIPTDARIDRRLDKLASSLRYGQHEYGPDADSLMLLAGVELMRNNEAAAYEAARCAYDLGERSRAVTVLLRSLDRYAGDYDD